MFILINVQFICVNSLPNIKKRNISFQYSAFIGLILIISYIAILVFLNGNYLGIALSDIMDILISFIAALCLFYAAFKSKIYGKQIYGAWLLLGIAQLLYTGGDILWTFIEVELHNVPFPSIADNLYLLYYVLFAIGLLLLSRPITTPEKKYRTLLDIGIIILSALIILWVTITSSVLGSTNDFLPLSLTLYYVIRDFVLFFLIINLIYINTTKRTRYPFLILLGGIVAYIITDAAFSYLFLSGMYVSNSLINAGWVIAFILTGLAGILQGNNASLETPETIKQIERGSKPAISSLIPLIWIGLSIFMLLWGYYNLPPSNFAIVQLKFVLFIILIIIRYMLSILEKRGYLNKFISINQK